MKWKQVGLVLAGLGLVVASAVAAQVMSVQVQEGQIRATPSFVGKIVAKVGYGQKVQVVEKRGDWQQVTGGSGAGWMHVSALSSKNLSLRSGEGAPSSVSGQEMALAGKGFNAQVEQQYRQSHGGNFKAVDLMAQNSISSEQLMAFLRAGEVISAGGM